MNAGVSGAGQPGQIENLPRAAAMEPTRDPGATLHDLVDVLLDKGVYLDLDLIITVADIPLIGINLRATLAGMETMLAYGMMKGWDERSREWARTSVDRHVPLGESEDLIAKMWGGHYLPGAQGGTGTWRPCSLCLTTERLIAFRRDPHEVLWQTALDDITGIELTSEDSVGGDERTRLRVASKQHGETYLSAADPARLRDMVMQARSRPAVAASNRDGAAGRGSGGTGGPSSAPDTLLLEDQVWYEEPRSGSPIWRGGIGQLDEVAGFTWKGALDQRPAVRVRVGDVDAVSLESGRSPTGNSVVLVVQTALGTYRLAGHRLDQWASLLQRLGK